LILNTKIYTRFSLIIFNLNHGVSGCAELLENLDQQHKKRQNKTEKEQVALNLVQGRVG